MKYYLSTTLLLASILFLMGCTTTKFPEDQRFRLAFSKDVPFALDSLTQLGKDCYCFSNEDYVNAQADEEIHADGSFMGMRTTFYDPKNFRQDSTVIWRNLFFNHKEQRVVCEGPWD